MIWSVLAGPGNRLRTSIATFWSALPRLSPAFTRNGKSQRGGSPPTRTSCKKMLAIVRLPLLFVCLLFRQPLLELVARSQRREDVAFFDRRHGDDAADPDRLEEFPGAVGLLANE